MPPPPASCSREAEPFPLCRYDPPHRYSAIMPVQTPGSSYCSITQHQGQWETWETGEWDVPRTGMDDDLGKSDKASLLMQNWLAGMWRRCPLIMSLSLALTLISGIWISLNVVTERAVISALSCYLYDLMQIIYILVHEFFPKSPPFPQEKIPAETRSQLSSMHLWVHLLKTSCWNKKF